MIIENSRAEAAANADQDFAHSFNAQVLWRMRCACILAALLALVFAVLDRGWLPPDVNAAVFRWRAGLLLPALLIGVMLTFVPVFRRRLQTLGACVVLVAGLALVMMVWTAHRAGMNYPYEGISLFLLLNYFLCGLRFAVAAVAGSVVSAAFALAEFSLGWQGALQGVMFVLASNTAGIVGSYISERQARATWRAERQLDAMANHDALTGLLNRRAFARRAREIFQGSLKTPHAPGALRIAMIDIDYFKRYNDHHGHPAGDTVLHAVALTLAAQLQGTGSLVARYGGEEFVALGYWTPGAPETAPFEQMRQQVQALEIPHVASDAAPMVSVSIGVARWHEDGGDTLEQALQRADKALYRAKAAGRNRVEMAADP